MDWLLNELDMGQTEGKLMIIATHVPIGVCALWRSGITGSWGVPGVPPGEDSCVTDLTQTDRHISDIFESDPVACRTSA